MFFLLNNEGTSAHCKIIPRAMFCFPTLGSPRWVPLTLIIFKLKVQEKSQIKGAYICSVRRSKTDHCPVELRSRARLQELSVFSPQPNSVTA